MPGVVSVQPSERSGDRRDPSHPLRRPGDYRSDGHRRRTWSRPERAYRLTRRRHPLATFTATLLAVLAPAFLVVAATDIAQPSHQSRQVVTGLTIPWAAGGMRIDPSGNLENFPGEWPDMPVQAVRLWDTRTAWLNIEQAQDQWEFAHLDANIQMALAKGARDITLVLWGTPTWAAASLNSNDAPWLGPGSASPPASAADWEDYVRHVVQRYAGQITAYEIGNEPNLAWFWRGTPEQLADLFSRAARIIHEIDPLAIVVAPAPLISSARDAKSFQPYFKALADSGAAVDVLAFHWYPGSLDPRALDVDWTAVRRAAAASGLPALPIWVTEAAYQDTGHTRASVARTLIPRTVAMAQALGIQPIYFYAWSDMPIGNLIPLHRGTMLESGLERSLRAGGRIQE